MWDPFQTESIQVDVDTTFYYPLSTIKKIKNSVLE